MSSSQPRVHSLFVGIDSYPYLGNLHNAVNDAAEMWEALTNDDRGQLDRECSQLILDDEATKEVVERAFHRLSVEVRANESIFIYFAGHAIRASRDQVLLAFSEASQGEVEELGTASPSCLPVQRIASEFLRVVDARSVAVVLDCCFSGQLHESLDRSGDRQFVVTATSADRPARESDDLGHGYFTHHLLEGIAGEAKADENGLITLVSAFQYAEPKTELQHPQMSVAKASGGYFPLARVVEVDVRDFRRPADAVEFKEPRHHLEPYIELIDQLCDGVASTANGRQADAELRPTEDGTRGLEGIRSVTGASAVLVRQYTRSGGRTVARSFAGGGARRIHESELLGSLEDRVRSPETFARRVPAVFAPPDEGGLVNAAIVGERGETTTVIYLAGVEEATAALDDVGCRMLAAFHRETSNGKPLAGHSVRAALIDHLRREGGYAPATLYEDRLALFDIQLRDLLIVFQPVIDFHKYDLSSTSTSTS